MEWLLDPTAWLGLATLVLLEIVLGIDNLVFVAILCDKLPPHQRDRARIIGLGLALGMRLVLLASISWLMALKEPMITILTQPFSGRDLILLGGGLFLIFKATMELHERLEGGMSKYHKGPRVYASFWPLIAQIVVLDAVFSIDSVITAVGMTDHLSIMFTAVTIAIGLMMLASKPLTKFVSAHPTVIVLCLGFLLLIGFALVADSVNFHIPKGYLYAAIGFSLLIETFNQTARFKRRRALTAGYSLRDRTAEAVLKLLGGKTGTVVTGEEIAALVVPEDGQSIFNPVERRMIRGVLSLSQRSIKGIMTPRLDVSYLDLAWSKEEMISQLKNTAFSRLAVVQDGHIESPVGIVQKKELLPLVIEHKELNLNDAVRQPPIFPDSMTVLEALERFKQETIQLAFVVDEFGTLEGILTLTDVTSAIAGILPEEGMPAITQVIVKQKNGSYIVAGWAEIHELQRALGLDVKDAEGEYHTAAGLALNAFGHLPRKNETTTVKGWHIKVVALEGNRIEQLLFTPIDDATNS